MTRAAAQNAQPAQCQLTQRVVSILVRDHACHAVLVYGSRARGDHSPASDLDIAGIRRGGADYRWATEIDGVFVDAFIFPEARLRRIGEQHLHMTDAVVVFDRLGHGRRLAARLKAAARRPPPRLPDWEIEVRTLWLRKMLARARLDDVEAHYRRAGLHEALLPDYFALRNLRYPGPKRALQWLSLHDTTALRLFQKALANPEDISRLERLLRYVIEPEPAVAPSKRSSLPRGRVRSAPVRA